MNLYSAFVAIVAIWAVVQISRHWTERRRHDESQAGNGEREAALERIEERVRNLERIVTDDREALKRRFDELE